MPYRPIRACINHPDRPQHGHGLCRSCWDQERYTASAGNTVTAPDLMSPESEALSNAYWCREEGDEEYGHDEAEWLQSWRRWNRGGPWTRGLSGDELVAFARHVELNDEADALEHAYAVTGGTQPHEVHVATEALCAANDRRVNWQRTPAMDVLLRAACPPPPDQLDSYEE